MSMSRTSVTRSRVRACAFPLVVFFAVGCHDTYVPKDGPFGLAMGMKPDDPWFQSDSTKLEKFDDNSGILRVPPSPYKAFSEYFLFFGSDGLCGIFASGKVPSLADYSDIAFMLREKYGEPTTGFPRKTAKDLTTTIIWREFAARLHLQQVMLSQTVSSSEREDGTLTLAYDFANATRCTDETKKQNGGVRKNPF